MTNSMQTTKQFYQHTETACVYAIERSWDGHIVGSFGPIEDDPKGPDDYEYAVELNDWLRTQNDKLIMV